MFAIVSTKFLLMAIWIVLEENYSCLNTVSIAFIQMQILLEAFPYNSTSLSAWNNLEQKLYITNISSQEPNRRLMMIIKTKL